MLPTLPSEADASSAFLTVLRQATSARQTGTAQVEAECLNAAARIHPLDQASLDSLTTGLLEQQRLNEAIELAVIIAQLDPRNAPAHFRLGYVLQMANRHAEAITAYRHALAIDPRLPRLRNNLAAALTFTGGDLSEQIALLEYAVRDEPDEGDELDQSRERVPHENGLAARARSRRKGRAIGAA